jgi:FkbM family methyltransferase
MKSYLLVWKDQQVKFSIRDPFSANFFATYFRSGKLYESQLLQYIDQALPEDGIFVDVGANIGYFTCLIAKLRSRTRVIAFEMGQQNFSILEKNVRLNSLDNVTIERYAVSDRTGVERCVKSEVGAATLQVLSDKNSIGIEVADIDTINAISLDDYFHLHAVSNKKVFKIDVEGAEVKVLSGMKNLLLEGVALFIEVHKKLLINYDHQINDLIRILEENLYEYKVIGNENKGNPVWYASRKKI